MNFYRFFYLNDAARFFAHYIRRNTGYVKTYLKGVKIAISGLIFFLIFPQNKPLGSLKSFVTFNIHYRQSPVEERRVRVCSDLFCIEAAEHQSRDVERTNVIRDLRRLLMTDSHI